ncbi:uncharacterized protein LOC129294086 [Prosopis cineraria]|uniref:uncharacterized protein LOC129294086 n=1 Tax=Prosopis cineraria TaxID=364024 RepID=UPI00240F6A9D|nr:uncharacterized protein LOC129294086 [Prosopis cineraria]
MASATIGIGNNIFVGDHVGKREIKNRCNDQLVVIGHQSRSRGIRKARMSTTTASVAPIWKYEGGGKDKDRRNDAVDVHERLDGWMKDSVVEIVKNLREAPLLVQVYPKKNANGGEATALRTEKAEVDDWPGVVQKWETGEAPLPEGVILVEELGDEGKEGKERTTKAWGVVVQGRGVGSGPICYLLKTSRVKSGPGMSPFCTYYCLVRVKSFRETVESQLKNCWLLPGQDS